MANDARILTFKRPTDNDRPLSLNEANSLARRFIDTPIEERSVSLTEAVLGNAETLFAVCDLLRDQMNVEPARVEPEVSMLYSWLNKPARTLGLFDERNYLLGDLALIGSTAHRHLGRYEEAEKWLDRADAAFRHIVNPGPMLAKLSYARLTLRYDRRQFSQVLELLPSVILSFRAFGMRTDEAKACFLEAMTLKQTGNTVEALEKFELLRAGLRPEETSLLGSVLVEVGAQHANAGRYSEASVVYNQALTVLSRGGNPMTIAHLKGELGETCRSLGQLETAVEYYLAAANDYARLDMVRQAACERVILAESLLALGRYREAEWQLLAALATIEEQKMVPEGFAAVALLRESARQRKTDPNALRELREHLQAKP